MLTRCGLGPMSCLSKNTLFCGDLPSETASFWVPGEPAAARGARAEMRTPNTPRLRSSASNDGTRTRACSCRRGTEWRATQTYYTKSLRANPTPHYTLCASWRLQWHIVWLFVQGEFSLCAIMGKMIDSEECWIVMAFFLQECHCT